MNDHSSEAFADAAIQLLLVVAFTTPHDPLQPPRAFLARYDAAAAAADGAVADRLLPASFAPRHAIDLERVQTAAGGDDVRDERRLPAKRDARAQPAVSRDDLAPSRVLATGRAGGLLTDGATLVTLTSDHGLASGVPACSASRACTRADDAQR